MACPQLFLKIHIQSKQSQFPTRTTRSLRVAFRRGLSLQESTEIIQLIKYLHTLFNLSHFLEGCVGIILRVPLKREWYPGLKDCRVLEYDTEQQVYG